MSRVLVIEDDEVALRLYERAITELGYTLDKAWTTREAFDQCRRAEYDAIVTDIPREMDGLTFIREVRRFQPDVPVVIVTRRATPETVTRAIEYGAFRCLAKPADVQLFNETLAGAVRLHATVRLHRQQPSPVEEVSMEDRGVLEARFAAALERVRIAFQPIVSWRGRTVVGYEALLRTEEPTLATPDRVLDAATRLGRINELGRAVRARTAEIARNAPVGSRLFVNILASDIMDDDLASEASPLAALGPRVTLEITERALVREASHLQPRLEALRRLGYRLAVDDLGAGYAGLSSLVLIEPEVVKVDMSLVRGVDADAAKQEVIRAIADLSAGLEMELIVEGVETTAEREALESLGCDLMQGFLFARPSFAFEEPQLSTAPA